MNPLVQARMMVGGEEGGLGGTLEALEGAAPCALLSLAAFTFMRPPWSYVVGGTLAAGTALLFYIMVTPWTYQ